MNRHSPSIILLFLTLLVLCALPTHAETNFDYFFKQPSEYKDVVVEKVNSADYIQLITGERIKLIGILAPVPPRYKRDEADEEREQQNGLNYKFKKQEVNSTSTIDEQSLKFAQELLKGKHVRLEFDTNKKDAENHTYAYVFILPANTFANAEILRQGFANLHIEPPNTKYADQLRDAYREARKEQRGLQAE